MTAPAFNLTTIGPGDVIAVRTGVTPIEQAIDIGGVLSGQSGLDNHVVVVHHQTGGVWWGVEGKPGGVGWADLRRYLADPHSVGNAAQPKSDAQRTLIAGTAEKMLGTPYDWAAIAADGIKALHLPELFGQNWHGQGAPAHVVCSSFAAYLYGLAGLKHPQFHSERLTTPGDWTEFSLAAAW